MYLLINNDFIIVETIMLRELGSRTFHFLLAKCICKYIYFKIQPHPMYNNDLFVVVIIIILHTISFTIIVIKRKNHLTKIIDY
jgi:hypothetical protein